MRVAPELVSTFVARRLRDAGGRDLPDLSGHRVRRYCACHPRAHVGWHKNAAERARRCAMIIADPPGYGARSAPAAHAAHGTCAKRAVGKALLTEEKPRAMLAASIPFLNSMPSVA
jgi:hypothetical protein